MAETTHIEWVDHTANPWQGCSKVPGHPGCDNCYAERMSHRNPAVLGIWGDDGTRVPSKSFAANLRRWNKQAAERGVVETVFPSLCDPFEDRPELVPLRQEMFQVADECLNIVLILLTKRPQNVRRMWANKHDAKPIFPGMPGPLGQPQPCIVRGAHRSNVWILTSVSDQATADKMVPELLKLRDLVPVLGLSIEPLLGPIDLNRRLMLDTGRVVDFVNPLTGQYRVNGRDECGGPALDWIIVGGESGQNARPMHPNWVRSLRDQAVGAGVPFFYKQWGEWRVADQGSPVSPSAKMAAILPTGRILGRDEIIPRGEDVAIVHCIGKAAAGRLLDGRTWDEFPTKKDA